MNKFIPFKQRNSVWDDIVPIEQYEGGEAPIAPISYSNEFVETMSYFRAIFLRQEISQRAFELTKEVILINQGCYSAWHFRRKLLFELKKDLGDEIVWLNEIGLQMEKNYQIWHHRRCIFEMWVRYVALAFKNEDEQISEMQNQIIDFKITDMKNELESVFTNEMLFLEQIFQSDSKNYHAWSYKVWIVERYELWNDKEHMLFIEKMLDNDVMNNSVWSFRYFLIMRKNKDNFSMALINMELRYTIETRIPQNWKNEASWTYLRGFLANSKEEVSQSKSSNAPRWFIKDFGWLGKILEKWYEIAQCDEFSKTLEQNENGSKENLDDELLSICQMRYQGLKQNRFLYHTLADYAIACNQHEKALKIISQLQDFDQIRNKFWEWKSIKIKSIQQ